MLRPDDLAEDERPLFPDDFTDDFPRELPGLLLTDADFDLPDDFDFTP